MYEQFRELPATRYADPGTAPSGSDPLAVLFREFGGLEYFGGLYRVHTAASAAHADVLVAEFFPRWVGTYRVFAWDWLGRQLAVSSSGDVADATVLLFDSGFGDVQEAEAPFKDFHDREIPAHFDDLFCRDFFAEWQRAGNDPLPAGSCAGYCVPPFLGGEDEVANLGATNAEVYWSLHAQIFNALRQP